MFSSSKSENENKHTPLDGIFKEGDIRGFDPYLRSFSIKSLLACCVSEHVLKVG